jgi:hypothetical protein
MKIKKQVTTPRTIPLVLFGLALGCSLFFLHKNNASEAADNSLFNANNIMSDYVMTNSDSMTEAQIQAFLNSKVTCDHWGEKWSELGGGTRAQYAQARGWALPFQCLNTYTQDGETSAHIIWQAAQDYSINPQVLIVLLQKEQSLVTDEWPGPHQYRSATGYGCPDTAACDSQYYGFKNQVRNAAKFFHAYQTGNPAWYKLVWPDDHYNGTWRQFYYNIEWHPKFLNEQTGQYEDWCGVSNTLIENRATASLYSYTPYRPNQAALNAGYGNGDWCSSYGNRNFFLYFTDWFGNTDYAIKGRIKEYYDSKGGEDWLGRPIENESYSGNGVWWQCFQNGCIIGSDETGFWESKGWIRERWAKLGYQNSHLGLPIGPEQLDSKGNWYQNYQSGAIHTSSQAGAVDIRGWNYRRWKELGLEQSAVGYPLSSEQTDGKAGWWQNFEHGDIFNGFESLGLIRAKWAEYNYQNGKMGSPISVVSLGANGETWQEYQNGFLILAPGATSAWESKGWIRQKWAANGYQNGLYGYPTGPEEITISGWQQEYEHGVIKSE